MMRAVRPHVVEEGPVRWIGRTLRLVAFLVAIVLLVTAAGLAVVVQRGFPQRSGTATLSGLSGPVDVVRDASGIPQVYASTPADLFAAEGWLHASERMWQMEIWRRLGSGRLAELFGESQVKSDAFVRTHGLAPGGGAGLCGGGSHHPRRAAGVLERASTRGSTPTATGRFPS